MIVGRGSSIEAFPLFGFRLEDYDSLFAVGVHAPGYVAETTQYAADAFFPGFARAVTDVGKERGWPAMTRASFDAQRGPQGALLIGSPDEVAEKTVRHSEALGGISRISFQMNAASLPHAKLMKAIETIGTRVAPLVRDA
jgi:alkanesulfonate monooxygenase SsuD/methylene tetrahydromethanopterin reductase-like flavin-dependent oxidoreductase (luciferase family)